MKRPTPFAWVDGSPYLIVNFDLEPDADSPSPQTCLERLLEHHDPATILVLRPLTAEERRVLSQASSDAAVEAWAQMIVKEEDRYRGRSKQRR